MTNRERLNAAVKKECDRLGVEVTETQEHMKDQDGNDIFDENGKPVIRVVHTITHISDEARELMKIFDMETPCWFRGCQQLRLQYKAEKEAATCRQCSGALTRKYMALAKPMLLADPDRKIPDLN